MNIKKSLFLVFGLFIFMIIPKTIYAQSNDAIYGLLNGTSTSLNSNGTSWVGTFTSFNQLQFMMGGQTSFVEGKTYSFNLSFSVHTNTTTHPTLTSCSLSVNGAWVGERTALRQTYQECGSSYCDTSFTTAFSFANGNLGNVPVGIRCTFNPTISVSRVSYTKFIAEINTPSSSDYGPQLGEIESNTDISAQAQVETAHNTRSLLTRFEDFVDNVMSTISSKLSDIKDSIEDIASDVVSGLSGFISTVSTGISNIVSFLTNNVLGLNQIGTILDNFLDDIEDIPIVTTIHDFLSLPVNFLSSLNDSSNNCSTLSFTIKNTLVTIPSGCIFWNLQGVATFKSFWNILFGGFLIYKLGFRLMKTLHNALDPQKDDLGGVAV